MRPMAMLAASGATLVALVVTGLAALDWEAASLEDSTPASLHLSRAFAWRACSVCSPPHRLLEQPRGPRAVHGPVVVLAVLDVAR